MTARSPVIRSAFAAAAVAVLLTLLRIGSPRPAQPAVAAPAEAPEPMREFRGVWIASVANIDWPSRPGLPTAEQQAELTAMFDRAAVLNLNAVILQVRPACDALYASSLEPWSEYLTGAMGRAPDPPYDPLAFAVEEAHRRGLELHAWFNPYRARHHQATGEISPGHVSRRRPELVRTYGRSLWLDPGLREVQDYTVAVILDVVRRYDVDGVHIDDYFYPYKERDAEGRPIDFPDEVSRRAYLEQGGDLPRDDWRRRNVDRFVERIYREIKREKRWVKFGISPFGIWRPGHPTQIKGFDQYAELYADARKWLREGWVDYCTPQLYWRIAPPEQSFPVLLGWWAEQNTRRRHLWPGQYTSRANPVSGAPSPGWDAAEIVEQIRCVRAQEGASGSIHFSARSLLRGESDLTKRLREDVYSGPALPPAAEWLGGGRPGRPDGVFWEAAPASPASPEAAPAGGEVGARPRVRWTSRDAPRWWLVQWRVRGDWGLRLLPGGAREAIVPAGADAATVRGVGPTGVLGRAVAATPPER